MGSRFPPPLFRAEPVALLFPPRLRGPASLHTLLPRALSVRRVVQVVPLSRARGTTAHLRAGEVDARDDVSHALAAQEQFAVGERGVARSPRSGLLGGRRRDRRPHEHEPAPVARVSASFRSVAPSGGASRDASASAGASARRSPSLRAETMRARRLRRRGSRGPPRGAAARPRAPGARASTRRREERFFIRARRCRRESRRRVRRVAARDGEPSDDARKQQRGRRSESGRRDVPAPHRSQPRHRERDREVRQRHVPATRAAPSVDMVSARAPVRGPRL